MNINSYDADLINLEVVTAIHAGAGALRVLAKVPISIILKKYNTLENHFWKSK